MKTETEKKGEISYRCFALLKVLYFVILAVAGWFILEKIIEVALEHAQDGAASACIKWIYFSTLIGLCTLHNIIKSLKKWSKKTLEDCENLGIFEG